MVKRILLLALISSRSNSRFLSVLCRYSVWVSRRGSVRRKGPPRAGLRVCASLSVGPSVWVTGGGSGTLDRKGNNANSLGVNSPVLGDYLTSWDKKPEGSNRPLAWFCRRGFRLPSFRLQRFHSFFCCSVVPHYFPFSVPFPPRIPRVTLKKVMATASVDSTIAAGLSVVRFPSSILCFRFSALQ